MNNKFITHPKSCNMTYMQHAVFTSAIATRFLLASLFGFIHALFPFVFKSFSNTTANYLNALLNSVDEQSID